MKRLKTFRDLENREQYAGFARVFVLQTTQCFVCRDTIFRGNRNSKLKPAWQSEHANILCCQCMDVWKAEGGELGQISRSTLKNGYAIDSHQ